MSVLDLLTKSNPLILINEDDDYVLQHQDVYDLQKYAWSGVLLPTIEEDYQARLNISDRTASKLSDVIKPLVIAYGTAQKHCQSFYEDTFRGKLPKLADDALVYAEDAAGGAYGPIFQDIIDIDSAATPEELKRLQDDLTARITEQYNTVTNLQTAASSCAYDLHNFKQQTREHQSSLKQCSVSVHDRTAQELGNVEDLQNKVKKCREEIKADTAEYAHDKLVACTTPSYVWLGFIGLIVASTIAGVYSKKAADMAARIDELRDELNRYEGNLKDESSIIADLTAIDGDLESLLDMLGPAIIVVEKMEGVWQSFAQDLSNMLEEIKKNVGSANSAIVHVVARKLQSDWANVAEAIKKYKQAMDVSLPKSAYDATVTIDDMSRQLHAQANK